VSRKLLQFFSLSVKSPLRLLQARKRPGFLLVEVLLGLAVFSLFIAAVGLTFVNSNISSQHGGNITRANFFARKGIEVARSIRDELGIDALTPGTWGYVLDAGGHWRLSGGSSLEEGYTTKLTLVRAGEHRVIAMAVTTWSLLPSRDSEVILRTELTDLDGINNTIRNWSAASLSGSCLPGVGACAALPANAMLDEISVGGRYAFVSADVSAGGPAGLYIFDISNAAAPEFIRTFSLGVGISGGDLGVRGDTLYILTNDPDNEIQAYDIENPLNPILLTSYNLPGAGVATALSFNGDHLYVGVTGVPEPPPPPPDSPAPPGPPAPPPPPDDPLCVDPSEMSTIVAHVDPMTREPVDGDANCQLLTDNCYTSCVYTNGSCTCTGRKCNSAAECGWTPGNTEGLNAPECSCSVTCTCSWGEKCAEMSYNWGLSISGVSGTFVAEGAPTDCDVFNGEQVLFSSGCEWDDLDGPILGNWDMQYNSVTGRMELWATDPYTIALYQSSTSFSCTGSITFDLINSPGECSGWPAQIIASTLDPQTVEGCGS